VSLSVLIFSLSLILAEIATSGDSILKNLGASSPKWHDRSSFLSTLSFLYSLFSLQFHQYTSFLLFIISLIILPLYFPFQFGFFIPLSCFIFAIIIITLVIVFFFYSFEENFHTYLTTWLSLCPVATFTEFHLSLLIKIIIQVKTSKNVQS